MFGLCLFATSFFDKVWENLNSFYLLVSSHRELSYVPQVILAMFLGVLLGLERRRKHKTAGVRTMMVISGASALITVLGVEMAYQGANSDATRIAASLLQSVGFIGAGVILTRGIATQGVTTASTILFAVGIGEACGFGMLLLAICGTLIMISGLLITSRFFSSNENCHPLTVSCKADKSLEVRSRFGRRCVLHGFSKRGDIIEFCIQPDLNVAQYEQLIESLVADPDVLKIHAEDDNNK